VLDDRFLSASDARVALRTEMLDRRGQTVDWRARTADGGFWRSVQQQL
jgi:hypothetical protein